MAGPSPDGRCEGLSTEDKDVDPPGYCFRLLAYTKDAIRNFGKTLNPTIDFRKHNLPEDALSSKDTMEAMKEIRQNPELLKRAYRLSGNGPLVKRKTCTTSGNKTYYLKQALLPAGAQS